MEGLAVAFLVFVRNESARGRQPGFVRACGLWRVLGGEWITVEEDKELQYAVIGGMTGMWTR